MILPAPALLVITDRRQAAQPLEPVITAVLAGGARWISLREKDLPPATRTDLLGRLVALGRACGATIMVHGDIEAAATTGADGIHLSRDDDPARARSRLGRRVLIGLSAHSAAEAEQAAARGADYVTLSPIFPSASKPGYGPALGLTGLAAVAARLAIPMIALGGVTEETLGCCLTAGAAGAAVMGPIMRATAPETTTARLIARLSCR